VWHMLSNGGLFGDHGTQLGRGQASPELTRRNGSYFLAIAVLQRCNDYDVQVFIPILPSAITTRRVLNIGHIAVSVGELKVHTGTGVHPIEADIAEKMRVLSFLV
jgi:hypothetical protein